MQNLEVKCTVSNCFFHKKGNYCGAEKIEINMDLEAKNKNRTEFASDFYSGSEQEKASTSAETCCNTFRPKNI
ncbi:MAG: DUF1540 domain-containing protein [Lysinibacillus sp.]